MKTAAMFHGTGGSPHHYWFDSTRARLERRAYSVWAPQLPDADSPSLDNWLPTALDHHYGPETVLIGHSAGCPLILSLLERLDTPVRQTVLVAGFARPLPGGFSPILQESYDWDRISANAGNVVIINSDNDPWGCDDEMGRFMHGHMGGVLVVPKGEGHMGSEKYEQPYEIFPLLDRLIE